MLARGSWPLTLIPSPWATTEPPSRCGNGEHARLQQRQLGVVASVERKRRDRVRPDEEAQLRAGRVDEWQPAVDIVHFLERAELQRDVEDDGVRHRECQAALHMRLEPGDFGPQACIHLAAARR